MKFRCEQKNDEISIVDFCIGNSPNYMFGEKFDYLFTLFSFKLFDSILNFQTKQTDTTIEEAFMMVVNDCRVKEGASNDDAVVVINHEVPTSPTQKCLFACFYETLGVVSDNECGQFFFLHIFTHENNAKIHYSFF